MLYSYKGLDKNQKEQRGYLNAESKSEAMQQLKYDKDLEVVYYLKSKVDSPILNKIRENKDNMTEKVNQQIKTYKEEKEKKRREKDAESQTVKITKKDLKNLGTLFEKLKTADIRNIKISNDKPETFQGIKEAADLNIFINNDENNDIEQLNSDIQEKPEIKKRIKPKEKDAKVEIDWSVIDNSLAVTKGKKTKKYKIKEDEIILFTKRLALMTNSGLSLLKALTIIQETVSAPLGNLISSVAQDIQNGTPFSSAIAKFPHHFDTTYIALVLIGESTGNFAQCLGDIVEYKERRKRTQKKIKSASIYPIAIAVVLSLVLVGGSLFFIPMFEGMFIEQGLELPTLTKVVFRAADLMPYLVGGLIVFFIGLKIACKQSVKVDRYVKTIMSKLALITPVIKNITLPSNMFTFSSTVALMLKNGLRLNEVLTLTIGVINNIYIKNEIATMLNNVVQGMPLSEAMAEQKNFETLLSSIVLTGEESGKLDEALTEISIYYDDMVNNRISMVMELIQPMSIMIVGIIAVPIVLAIYLPIFDISSGGVM